MSYETMSMAFNGYYSKTVASPLGTIGLSQGLEYGPGQGALSGTYTVNFYVFNNQYYWYFAGQQSATAMTGTFLVEWCQ